jgi:hypothetical protein
VLTDKLVEFITVSGAHSAPVSNSRKCVPHMVLDFLGKWQGWCVDEVAVVVFNMVEVPVAFVVLYIGFVRSRFVFFQKRGKVACLALCRHTNEPQH